MNFAFFLRMLSFVNVNWRDQSRKKLARLTIITIILLLFGILYGIGIFSYSENIYQTESPSYFYKFLKSAGFPLLHFLYTPQSFQLTRTRDNEIVATVPVLHFASISSNSKTDNEGNYHNSKIPNEKSTAAKRTFIVYADPPDACQRHLVKTLLPKTGTFFHVDSKASASMPNWILLVNDLGCDRDRKIGNAEAAGFSEIIIHASDESIEGIQQNTDKLTDHLHEMNLHKIPVNFITNPDGFHVRDHFAYSTTLKRKKYTAKLVPEWDLISELIKQTSGVIYEFYFQISNVVCEFLKSIVKWFAFIILMLMMLGPISYIIIMGRRSEMERQREEFEWEQERIRHARARAERQQQEQQQQQEDEENRRREEARVRRTAAFLKIVKSMELLGVRDFSDKDAINRAYHKQIRLYHPDKNQDKPQSVVEELNRKSQELTEARNFLLNLNT